jgi:hypothetical protein
MTDDELRDRFAELADSVAFTDRQVRTLATLQEQNSRDITRLYEMWVEARGDIRRLYTEWTEHYRNGHAS